MKKCRQLYYRLLLLIFMAFSITCLYGKTIYAQPQNTVETGTEIRIDNQVENQAENQIENPAENQIENPAENSAGSSSRKENASGITLHAQSAVLLDADTGRVLYGKGEELIRPMASTTKIMTCILALENGNPEDVITVSANAARQPKVHLGAPAGRTFYLKDLLYSLMLESHNDSAVMIAEHLGGSVEGFAEMMNEKARQLGCNDTWFITPNGLDASVTTEDGKTMAHSTTGADLAAIMRYCVWQSPKKEEFLEITRTQNYYFMDTEGKGAYSCVNHNAFLTMADGVLSGKTGFTGGAGYSYVAAMEDGDRHFTMALLGCGWPPHKTYKWSDARALYSYGKEHYQKREVYQETKLKEIPVENGIPEDGDVSRPAYACLTLNLREEEKTLKVLMREDENVQVQVQVPDQLKAPVKQGTAVGQILYSIDGMEIKRYPVYVRDAIERLSFGWCLKKVGRQWLPF